MSEWQPIETAPRDGTPILVYELGVFSVVWWEGGEDGGWDNGEWGQRPAPSHWVPIPPAPQTEDAKAQQEPGRDDLGGLTEAQVIAGGYTVEGFKAQLVRISESVAESNRRFRALTRWGLPDR